MDSAIVVDDSRAVRMILSRILKGLGYAVTEASNGLEALSILERSPGCQLALVDWNMPVMTGLELVRALRTQDRFRDLSILMVTTETEPEHMSMALEAGANDYIMKPFTEEVLVEKLQVVGFQF